MYFDIIVEELAFQVQGVPKIIEFIVKYSQIENVRTEFHFYMYALLSDKYMHTLLKLKVAGQLIYELSKIIILFYFR